MSGDLLTKSPRPLRAKREAGPRGDKVTFNGYTYRRTAMEAEARAAIERALRRDTNSPDSWTYATLSVLARL
jgi:hypothetical protein